MTPRYWHCEGNGPCAELDKRGDKEGRRGWRGAGKRANTVVVKNEIASPVGSCRARASPPRHDMPREKPPAGDGGGASTGAATWMAAKAVNVRPQPGWTAALPVVLLLS